MATMINRKIAGGVQAAAGDVAMPRWTSALARMRDGQSNAKVAFLGSSTMLGLGNATRDTSFIPKLKKLLSLYFAPAFTGMTFGGGNLTQGAWITFDPRVTLTSGWQMGSSNSPIAGNYPFNVTNITGLLKFASDDQFDTIEVLAQRDATCGTFTVSIDGGVTPLANVYTGETAMPARPALTTPGLEWFKFTVPLGTNTVTIKQTVLGTGTRIHAIKTSNSTVKGIELWNWGISGATAANFLGSQTSPFSGYNLISLHNPDLIVIGIGSNYWATGKSQDLFLNEMGQLIDRCKAAGADVVILGSHPTGVSITPLGVQAAFIDLLARLAESRGCAFLNLWPRFGTYELATTNGLAPATPDNTHMGPGGHSLYAQAISWLLSTFAKF